MGRIKSLMVKRAAKQLIVLYKSRFSVSFEENKKVLGNRMPSKSVRNKIAGYLSRLSSMEESRKKKEIEAEKLQSISGQKD